MYSNSNSYLGGGNSGRAYGQSPFGSQPPPNNNFSGQQQPGFGGGIQPQPTGFGGGLQPQPTGYGGMQTQQTGFGGGIQPQYTGYPPQQQQQQQQQSQPQPQFSGYSGQQQSRLQSQATGYLGQQQQPLQSQYTGFPTQNASSFQSQAFQTGQQNSSPAPTPASRQQPQPTGMTSSQVADSFRGSAAKASSPQPSSSSNKIPSIRLSFITAADQAKFEQLFKSAVGSEQSLSGDQARDLLLRSKLPGDTLSQIWMLSDTTKSGRLLFPEFALSMYLCNVALVGKQLPTKLPDTITNEVSSMVDRISFNIPDDMPSSSAQSNSNVPNFNSTPSAQAQQPQPTSGQLLSQLMSQPTGYQSQQQSFQPPQSFQPQPTGFMPHQTSFQNSSQLTGYSQGPMQPMATGFGGPASIAPLNAQPTGRPGTWGLVNAPASGLPNMQALQSQMMPQQGREGGYTSTGLRGNATVPWAVTKDEKKIYDNLFKAWDGFGKGYITGNQAIEIFGQSGLGKPDLERIWTLSDPSNRGRLDLDEFAVAMHLIYRKLNGYPVPARLPPELVPPSTRNLNASLTGIKSLLSRDAEERKNSGAFLEPQKTGVSYLKNHSFSGTSGNASGGRKDATVYRNNDDVGYKSTARRRIGADGRSQSPDTASPPPEPSDDLSIEQLRKKVREKQVILDAIDFQDENNASQDDALDRKDKKDADELFRRIRSIQEDIDKHPNSIYRTSDSDAERRTLRRQLQGLTDKLPDIASQVRRAERAIADAQLELFRLKDAKANPTTASAIVGTGPGGAVTESDRLKARAKAMMQQRSAALSGKSVSADNTDTAGATRRLEEESARVRAERENNDRMVKDIEESVSMFSKGVEDGLKEGGQDDQSEHERRRWEDGLGVEDEVKDFIFDLQRSSRSARVRREDDVRKPRQREASSPKAQDRTESSTGVESPAPQTSRPAAATSGSSYASYKTAEERAAFIKQQAEARMAERLAALGLRAPPKAAESLQARQEREKKEKEERLRQAEAEDAKREQERHRRLEDEQISPPSASKKPPPPPSRNGRSNSIKQAEEVQALKAEEEVQMQEVKILEDAERQQEEELQREREASDARRKALEEQVRQGKMKKEEEKRRKQAAQQETKAKEDRLAAQRAELEAARAREQELQRQLEALGNEDSSDDDEGQRFTPSDTTGTASQELLRDSAPEPQSAPPAPPTMPPVGGVQTVASPPGESKNPFFRKVQANAEQAPLSTAPPTSDTNPFHRMTTVTSVAPPQPAPSQDREISAPAPSRPLRLTAPKAEDDDWSVVNSEDSSSDDDDPASQPTGAGNARNLASILFGSMGPPRSMSGMSSGGPASPAPVSSPHAPPPMPGSFEPAAPSPVVHASRSSDDYGFSAGAPPPAPPPPTPGMPSGAAPPPPPGPPPMPGFSAPPPPPMPGIAAPPPPSMPSGGGMPMGGGGGGGRAGLLGEIQAGKGLRKVQTKDKSTAATAGRVLN